MFLEDVRVKLASGFFEFEDYFIVDSMLLEICKFAYHDRIKICKKEFETLFSQLCDQFMNRRNYAKSFQGFKTRILVKITFQTLVQYINKFIFDRLINNIKNQTIYLYPTGYNLY